jgi:RNA polymerase sigma-70 factor (ECF subfamily)
MDVHKAPLPLAGKLPGDESHEKLLQRVGAGRDREAFAQLFSYFAPRLKSYMLKHGAGEAGAEEIVQNTFITVWEKAAGFDPKKAAASTWIFTIARNKRIDALRREKHIEVDIDNPALQLPAEQKEEDYAGTEDVEKLNAALASLPDEQKKLLQMAFYEDMSHSDIAKETKIPLGTVKSRLRLAMEKLRGKMGEAP